MGDNPSVVVLIGPMGVGKTTVGKKLAKALKLPFLDTDAIVVARHGEISDIFEREGEPAFRAFEEAAVAEAISQSAVVATGGGAVLSQATRDSLAKVSVVYLATDGRHMKSRLTGGKRPLVQAGFDDWVRIYEERKPIYQQCANITVNTSGLSLSATVSKIREGLGI